MRIKLAGFLSCWGILLQYIVIGFAFAAEPDPDDDCPLENPICPSADYRCCKVVGTNEGCKRYQVHLDNNHWSSYYITDPWCHIEDDGLPYPKNRACKKFDVEIENSLEYWTCKKEEQTGEAVWTIEYEDDYGYDIAYWDVSPCECNIQLSQPGAGCQIGIVNHQRNNNALENAKGKIIYNQTRRYCNKCLPGFVPQQASAASSGMYYQPEDAGQSSWGTYKCEQVNAPYYATGCTIDFNEPDFNDVLAVCQSGCDSYLTITANGATSADSCAPDSGIKYTDSTGEFILGSDKCNN